MDQGPVLVGREKRPSDDVRTIFLQPLHPALSPTLDSRPNIYPSLLTWVFKTEKFETWQKSEKKWPLRVCGRPGSGKTVFSALAAEHLSQEYKDDQEAVAIVSICADVVDNEDVFVEDFLRTVFDQLSFKVPSPRAFEKYREARVLRQRVSARIRLLRESLHLLVSQLDKAFLIVDDFDRCSAPVHLQLEDEFLLLQEHGLRILTTSRISYIQEPFNDIVYRCDNRRAHRDDDPILQVYFACQRCRVDDFDVYNLCLPCKSKGLLCGRCGELSQLIEPYDFIELDISLPGGELIEDFVAWSLEREHGDLGLDSSSDTKPPLSALGRTLKESKNRDAARHLVEKIAAIADNNIALAGIRLEMIHQATTAESTPPVTDRLPGPIHKLFDAAIEHISLQPRGQADVALMAIAAVSHHRDGVVRFSDLDRWLDEASKANESPYMAYRSLEDILQATKGFLVATVTEEGDRAVMTYHGDFMTYASRGYNKALSDAKMQLKFDRYRNMQSYKRSETMRIHASPEVMDTARFAPLKRNLSMQLGVRT